MECFNFTVYINDSDMPETYRKQREAVFYVSQKMGFWKQNQLAYYQQIPREFVIEEHTFSFLWVGLN